MVRAASSLQDHMLDPLSSAQDSLGPEGQGPGTCAISIKCTSSRKSFSKGGCGLLIPQASVTWSTQALFELENKIHGALLNT